MTLGPVRFQASLVTLKIPAPISIPIRVAYDSMVPRSRRKRATGWGELVEDDIRSFILTRFQPGD
jgi:hypothetical protein